MNQENNRIALVTGVGRAEGIGFEVCRQLASQPMTVLLTARSADQARKLAGALQAAGIDVRPYALDVTAPESVQQLAETIEREFGRLDVLVNNAAGVAPYGEVAATADLATAQAVLETTLLGSWRVCQRMLPLLRASTSGRIVNVSSGAGSHGDPVFGLTTTNGMGTSYAVAKAALNALTAKLALEEKQPGLLINAVCPGFTATFEGGLEMGARPVAEGAASVVWAALLENGGPTGGFFRDGKPLPW
jgi:NAD(P)-dependent dehydrogenase (short-subunit alcohol dehydrogenase family)